ncbi:MAG: histidine kinase [Roseivirga sp.]|uniref:sensor histidine kinase n=1 Tax=Roseivirga sp. TaxID=1964215 RepID=UPI001B27D7D9|nr:histidine kinase [Roseivirga sp.]MBO6496843.1 histidine kinase [Roseivirga sp.]
MRKRRLYWILQLVGWGLYFSANFISQGFDPQSLGEQIVRNQRIELTIHSIFFFLLSHYFIRGITIKRGWLQINITKVIPRILGVILLASIIGNILSFSLYFVVGTRTPSDQSLQTEIPLLFGSSFVLFVLWSTVYFLYHYLESNNRSLKYEAAMNEMHLNQLKAQLNPHFIFNALNSMRALVDEEPTKAKIAITQLSNILRNSLITDKKRVVNFRNELNTVKDYLALEGIRFEERLKIKYKIDPRSDHFDIPPMMMQTLVENAIKHGVSNLMEGGLIEIQSNVTDSMLTIKIRNSGQLSGIKKKPTNRTGVGLINTKERLKLIYGDTATFNIYNENDKFVVTEVKIPQRI